MQIESALSRSLSPKISPELTLSLIPGRGCPATGPVTVLRRQAYAFWHENWLQTFREHNGEDFHLSSDSFVLADAVLFLHDGDEPVALGLVNLLDLTSMEHRALSFLDCATPASLDALVDSGALQAFLARFFTIAPAYRRHADLSYKKLLFNLLGAFWRSTEADVLIGTARQNRGITKAMVAMGGQLLEPNLQTRGITVDLVAMRPERLVLFPDVTHTSERLWRERNDFVALPSVPC